ncbi:MAG: hypothetical protein WDM88_11620 [Galbitalea sp.]
MPATETATPVASGSTRARTVVVLVVAIVVAILVNSVIAIVAHAAGASADFSPLLVYVYAPFTLIGFLAAYAGWRIVCVAARAAPRSCCASSCPCSPCCLSRRTRFSP